MVKFLKRLFGKGELQNNDEKKVVELGETEEASVYSYEDDLTPQIMGDGKPINYEHGGHYGTVRVCWGSEENEDGVPKYIRENDEKIKIYPSAMPFTAAGKIYRGVKQLCGEDASDGVHTDVYGRAVLCYKERFPCFDSYDFLHEHRYDRWFFLREHGKLTRIYTKDESGWIYVTEDVENIECKCIEQLKECGWVK